MKVRCLYDELAPIDGLTPHPKNRNKHPDDQIKRLAEILKYQGWRYPIKVSKQTGLITSGHGRLLAARLNGWDKVPINKQDYENEDQEYADVQADNAIASWAELDLAGINLDLADLGPDFDLDLLGIKDFELEPADKFHADEDEVPEPPKEPISKLGDLYELGNHRLMCGDSTSIDAVDKLMSGQKADMVFTDPPYGINVQMNNSKGHNPLTAVKIMGDETTAVAVDSFRVCAVMEIPQIWWGANHYVQDAKLPNAKCWIAWNKQESNNHIDQADCELAWTNIDSPARQFHHLWAGFRRDSEKGETRVHPTQKPVKLIEEIVDHFGAKIPTQVVLDLFGGSGSTLIACEKTNRKCFMMELDPHYCDVIVARWEKYTGQKAEMING